MSKKIPSVIRISAHPTYCRCAMKEHFDIKNTDNEYTMLEKIWLHSFRKANCIFGPSRIIGQIIGKKINREIMTIESPVQVDRKCALSKNMITIWEKKISAFFGTLNYLKGIIDSWSAEPIRRVDRVDSFWNRQWDCFISTSSSEGLPVSIQEAMAFGIPIIATVLAEYQNLLKIMGYY